MVTGAAVGTRESGGTATGGAHSAPAASRRFRVDLSTTPGRLRALLVVLVLLSLAWGALAAFTVNQYSSAASSLVGVREPLVVGAQQIYHHLSDADDTAATAFLAGGLEPTAARQRYLADIRTAEAEIETATAQGGAAPGAASKDLATISEQLPVYAGEIETARADNRLGLPLGAAYLREASTLMRNKLLPAADDMYATENASLGATNTAATGRPLIYVVIAAALGFGLVLYLASRWLGRRTHRMLNWGLLIAAAVLIIAVIWLISAFGGARGDLLTAQSVGSAPVAALARADIAALQAHADESLTLIDNSGDDSHQHDYLHEQTALGPGQGTLLTLAQSASPSSPATTWATRAATDARQWYTAHAEVRALDDNGKHTAAVCSALGSGPDSRGTAFAAQCRALGSGSGAAGAAFARVSADLTAGISAGQGAFAANASDGASAYTAAEPVVIVAALIMAAGCAWGLSRRLAEYR